MSKQSKDTDLGSIVGFKLGVQPIEIYQLIKLLVAFKILPQRVGEAYFLKLVQIVGDMDVTPAMEGSKSLSIKHYNRMAQMIADVDVDSYWDPSNVDNLANDP